MSTVNPAAVAVTGSSTNPNQFRWGQFPMPDWKGLGPWVLPAVLLGIAYGLLGLTQTTYGNHRQMMERCVLMNPDLARIWSVANIEIGVAYLGIFAGMTYYIVQAARANQTHLRDLCYAFLYLGGSFALDVFCVMNFEPWTALLIGDAIVMTFTLLVSRQIWFQRLLGIFVPIIFLTCGIGHSLEGLSFWNRTYPFNVPWTMVTADIGFAVLVNAARFPAFIRGADLVEELALVRREAQAKHEFVRDVLRISTENRLFFCANTEELPDPLPVSVATVTLTTMEEVPAARRRAAQEAKNLGFGDEVAMCAMTIVGEGGMNTVRHGNGGLLRLTTDDQRRHYQIRLEDNGTGIPLNLLPRAVLERGYSTVGTAGQGFMLMLNMADRTDLLTGAGGTTIVFTLQHPNQKSETDGEPVSAVRLMDEPARA